MNMNLRKLFLSSIALILVAFSARSQNGSNDTIPASIEKINSSIQVLKKLKISGYIQAQFQIADSTGIESFAGGNFTSGVDNRFSIRRGRVKFLYDNELSQYVLQFDVTEKGVGIKDAYVSFTDPWLRWFSITAGCFNRPFGYEIEFSSNQRESPERSRMYQTLFPGERDLGVKLTIQGPKSTKWNMIKLDAALINGTGPAAVDFDKYKDFTGHLSLNKSLLAEKMNFGLGFSYYNGGWGQGTKYNYKMKDVTYADGTVRKMFAVDSTRTKGDKSERKYMGIDAQVSFDFPFGLTFLRGEFISGTQPGTSGSSATPAAQPAEATITTYSTSLNTSTGNYTTTASATTPNSDTYVRKFHGFYIYWSQYILHTKHQFIVKYDVYNPNVDATQSGIGTKTGLPSWTKATGAADIKYSTLGLGWIYHWNANVRITAYYDMVSNENTAVGPTIKNGTVTNSGYQSDRPDNVLTLRVQYKF